MSARPKTAAAVATATLVAGGLALMADASPVMALVAGAAAAGSAAWASVAAGAARIAERRAAVAPSPKAGDGLGALLDALPVGVLAIGADGTIRFANSSVIEAFGLPRQPLPAAALRAPRLLQRIEAAMRDGESATVDFPLARGTELHLRAHVRPDGAGGAVIALEDRTEARRAAELHRDFVANASHELKTPLAAVSAFIETLLGHAREDSAATERFLGMMGAQVRRMTRLVEDLLSLNRIELNERVAPREAQDLAAIIGEAVDALRPSAEEAGARLMLEVPEDLPAVRGDRNELGQVFRNLIENALKYGGPDVQVTVATVAPPPESAGQIGVAVRDTGPGIAREHLPRLTERFYRVSVRRSRERGGTGLGLAIVKHIVARHRGRLQIESREGEGSCFTVWLPLAEVETPSSVEPIAS